MNYYRNLFLETVPRYKKYERKKHSWYIVFAKIGDEFIQEERVSNTPINAIRGFINQTLKQHEIRVIDRLNRDGYIYIKHPGEHIEKRFKQRRRDQIISEKLAVVYIHGLDTWEDLIEIVAAPDYVDPRTLRDILFNVRNGIPITDPDIDIETELF